MTKIRGAIVSLLLMLIVALYYALAVPAAILASLILAVIRTCKAARWLYLSIHS